MAKSDTHYARNSTVTLRCAPKHYFNQTPLYERNYGKLLRFFRGAHNSPSRTISHRNGMLFSILVKEDHKYTSLVELSVVMSATHATGLNLSMTVRMCHDAKVAEVIESKGHANFEPEYGYPNKHMLHRDEKRQLNCLLGEWLDFFARTADPVVVETQDA